MDKPLSKIILLLLSHCIMFAAQAARPVWTITPVPGSQTTQQISANSTVTIQYIVQNQSARPHNLIILPIPGIQQTGPCILGPRGYPNSSCTLSLIINSSQLSRAGIHDGPVLCQSDSNGTPNPNQCYQPSVANRLNLTVGPEPFGATGAFVVSFLGQFLNQCAIDINGSLTACASSAPSFPSTAGVAINRLGTIAYVVSSADGTSAPSAVYKCDINNQAINNCVLNTSLPSSSVGITLNKAGTKAYIVASYEYGVYVCDINANNDLTDCVLQGNPLFEPFALTLNPTQNFLYVTSSEAFEVSKCSINNSGNIINCDSLNSSPALGIAINATGNLAYLALGPNLVSKCTINSAGNFSTCVPTGNNFSFATSIALDAIRSIAYVTDLSGGVFQCRIEANGDLTACDLSQSVPQAISIVTY